MTRYLCAKCGKNFTDPIWVADYNGYDEREKNPHVWKQNTAYGRAQMKGFCPHCGSDCLSKENA